MHPAGQTAAIGPGERLVTLVLCDASGALLGELDPFLCRPQHWPEMEDVVATARSDFGLEVTVLRMLSTEAPYAGGAVSYLAQLTAGSRSTPLPPVGAERQRAVDSDPTHRLWWAEPGWLDEVGDWVDDALSRHGRSRTGRLHQRRTWNLSCVLTAPTTSGTVWIKAGPPFLADEGGIIARVANAAPDLPPRVIAHDRERRAVLMEHVPGEDQWGLADDAVIETMLRRWVRVQAVLSDDVEHCLSVGAADGRTVQIVTEVRHTLDRAPDRSALSTHELVDLEELVADLPRLLAEIDACGLPDTLVHGDLHPGNWRRGGANLTLLDWGGSRIGNPALDLRAFVERISDAGQQERARSVWADAWRRQVPGCDPARAVELIEPVAQLCAATAYQHVLDHIEQAERPYHALDPDERLRAALAAGG